MKRDQNRIRYWRQLKKWSAEELGLRCKPKLHKQTVLRVESGDMETTINYLRILSKALDVPMRELIPHEDELVDATPSIKMVPVLALQDAYKHPHGLRFRAGITYVRVPMVVEGSTLLAGVVHSPEMTEALLNGAAIVWDVDNRKLENGAYYVIKTSGRAVWRRYRKRRDGAVFEPDGDPKSPVIDARKAKVIGRVVGVHKTFL